MKKFLSILTATLLCGSAVATFAACGGNNGPSGVVGGEFSDDAETRVVRVWAHKSEAEDEGKVYATIAELFNEQDIKADDGKVIRMRLEFYSSAETLSNAINSEIAAGTGGLPDILAVDAPNIAAYADAEILTDISACCHVHYRGSR